MGAIHNRIKSIRAKSDLTQQEMADRLNIHLKTWQKIENGVTRLDIERLKQISQILETTIEDLINSDDGVYIAEIKNNDVGYNKSTVHINHKSDVEMQLYERIIAEKDRIISEKDREIEYLRDLLARK